MKTKISQSNAMFTYDGDYSFLMNKKTSKGLSILQKSFTEFITLLAISALVLTMASENSYAQNASQKQQNSRVVSTVKYHGEFIQSVSFPVITISANKVSANQNESKTSLNNDTKVAGASNYNGEIIPSVNLPEIEISADRTNELATAKK